ncbi:hypothetical protein HPB49_008448 [Dermacentor silvarum]|uniref:Uncharacterized protein n=1 Tax=Dermacentor silvarum TaxID=543639 RepID=A0ACB8CK60_DERSI|nr:hypothetical protein HPB49_008448 [Dermacentor silvarum]
MFQPFLDTEGLLRVKGRVQFCSVRHETRHAVLLPKEHAVTELLVNGAHLRTLHGGVQATMTELRELFWIQSSASR